MGTASLCYRKCRKVHRVSVAPPLAPRITMYPPGAPGIGQQMFYGQAPPAIMPHQAWFGYQHQLVPGMRGGWRRSYANFFVPMVQQGQQAQRPGGRCGTQAQQAQRLVGSDQLFEPVICSNGIYDTDIF